MNLKKIALIGVLFYGSSTVALANNENLEFLKAEDIRKITLLLSPEGVRSRSAITESNLLANACKFESTLNPSKNLEMAGLLTSHLKEQPQGTGKIELRNIVYLSLRNGQTIKILLSGSDNPKKEVFGGIDNGRSGSYLPLSANDDLLKGLRLWASKDVSRKNFSASCLN